MADDSRFFDLEIITPDRVFWSGKASMLEMNTTEGQVGIYKKHIPMTMILQPGIVKLHLENEIKEAAIHAGFVEILPDKISMMAEVAEWPDEIDLNRAEKRFFLWIPHSAPSGGCRHTTRRSICPEQNWR